MRINCWHEVGRKNAPKDSLRCPRTSAKELRSAIRAARDGPAGEGSTVLFEQARRYSAAGRAGSRVIVGVATVAVIGALIGAVFVPVAIVGAAVAAAVGGVTYWIALDEDRSVTVRADGVLITAGWDGVREVQLRDYPRVTVQERKPIDLGAAPME